MVKRGSRKTVGKEQTLKYLAGARALRKSAEDVAVIAEEHHGNAIAIMVIHAAIAYADALCISYGGFKSTEGQHERVVEALKDALGRRVEKGQTSRLLSILKEKDSASYQGVLYRLADARRLLRKLGTFGDWAEGMYELRP